MKKLAALFTMTILTGLTSNAGLLLDPYLNYITSGSTSNSATVTGNEIGVRVGYDFLGFGVGIDTLLSGKYTSSLAGVSTDKTPTQFGLFACYKFPILVRGYISFLTSAKEKDSSGNEVSGTATKIGIQYTGLPFIAIGLETYAGSYKDATIGGVTTSTSQTASHTNLTISAPFSF